MYYADIKQICQHILLAGLSPEQQQERVTRRGYRLECVKMLSQLSSYSINYIRTWGRNWEKMSPTARAGVTIAFLRHLLGEKDEQIALLKRQLEAERAKVRRYETFKAAGRVA